MEAFRGKVYGTIYPATGLCLRCLPEKDHIPVGYIHVDVEEPYDFGYGLRKEFWHQGIMTEAAIAVTEQLKKTDPVYYGDA